MIRTSANGTAYVIGAGSVDRLSIRRQPGDLILAADAGLLHCKNAGIIPDVTVGDFDSLGGAPDSGDVIRLNVRKDDTDVSFAVRHARACGCTRFIIYGGTGGLREDHTFANLALLADIAKRGETGALVGCGYCVTAITDRTIRFSSRMRGTLSVFAFDTEVSGLTERGTDYTVNDINVKNSDVFGVSNAFTGQQAEISVRHGTLLIYYQADTHTDPIPLPIPGENNEITVG